MRTSFRGLTRFVSKQTSGKQCLIRLFGHFPALQPVDPPWGPMLVLEMTALSMLPQDLLRKDPCLLAEPRYLSATAVWTLLVTLKNVLRILDDDLHDCGAIGGI